MPIPQTLADVLRLAIEFELNEWHVCMPGRIESYNPLTGLATVKPMLSRRFDGDEESTEYPVLQKVIVVHPRTATASITLPVAKNDLCLLVFVDRSIENWIESQGTLVKEVQDLRQHDLSDAFAIMGGYPILAHKPPQFPNALNIELAPNTKIAITNGTVELLDLMDQLIDEILLITQAITPTTGPTLSPLTNAAKFTAIKTKLAQLKTI